MTARIYKQYLVIRLPLLEKPRPSKSGKSQLIATSRGPQKVSVRVDRHAIFIIANAFFRTVSRGRRYTEQRE